jgi:CheY-like chemotaxis protein
LTTEQTITAKTKPPETAESSTTRRQNLLLVDDNPINIKVLSLLVRKLNHDFATASNGLEAVQLYNDSLEGKTPRFDLVFMDITMPVMNGFEATREIRLLEARAGVERCKVVALTGLSSEVNQNEASACGVDVFLTKPIKPGTIKALLAEEEAKKKAEQ